MPADEERRRALPRMLPEVAFPPYTYVPGKTPHPVREPAGHSFGTPSEPYGDLPLPWHRCRDYLRGVDLFNHGYYWEAHEAWEAAWHAAGRAGPIADLLKGLIKLAAAGVKTRAGSVSGRQRHCRRAAELFRSAAQAQAAGGDPRECMGLLLETLASWAVDAERDAPVIASPSGDPPRVFRFLVLPERVA